MKDRITVNYVIAPLAANKEQYVLKATFIDEEAEIGGERYCMVFNSLQEAISSIVDAPEEVDYTTIEIFTEPCTVQMPSSV